MRICQQGRIQELELGVVLFLAGSSFLQTSSEDINIEDDATTQPAHDEPNVGDDPP